MNQQIVIERNGTREVLAVIHDDQAAGYAQCSQPGCPTTLQRSPNGDLADGVRAHYKTVHPERRIQ